MRTAIHSDAAPKAIGPYSQAVRAGQYIFLSGQTPIDPATGALVDGDIAAQTRRAMNNLAEVLKAAGASFDNVVKTSVFLADMNDFATMNEIYGSYFKSPYPARTTIQAARLPKDCLVEIDAIAVL